MMCIAGDRYSVIIIAPDRPAGFTGEYELLRKELRPADGACSGLLLFRCMPEYCPFWFHVSWIVPRTYDAPIPKIHKTVKTVNATVTLLMSAG